MRRPTASAMGLLALLGASLSACAGPTGGRSWSGPDYYPGGYTGRSYGSYYPGPGYYRDYRADRYGAFQPHGPRHWTRPPEHRSAPRTQNWSQDRLRQHWDQLKQRDCAAAGIRC